jgi:hypothetical protein
MNMAVFVTNPASRSNGAVNILIAKHLGVNIRTEAGRKAVAAFKRTAAYKAWLKKSAKAITSERAAKKSRTAASKTPAAKKARAAFLARVRTKKAGRKAGRKASTAVATTGAGGTRIHKTSSGKLMYFVGGKPTGRLKYEAAVGKAGKAPAAKASASKAKGRGKGKGRRAAKKNPYGFRRNSGLSDSYAFLKQRVATREGLMAAGTAIAVGAGFFYVTPMIADNVGRIPVVGQYVERAMGVAPYTLSGLLIGAAAVAAGYYTGQRLLGWGLAAASAGAGISFDTLGYLNGRSGMGAIEYSGPAYGALEVTNPGYGSLMVTNPGGYGADDAAAASEYVDATEADAYQSGEDFDEDEGQALLGGPRAFFRRFGRPPRVASRGQSAYSRHAGKPGHKWGFLIKLLGFRRVAEIAAMPVQQRLAVLSDLRARCFAAFTSLMQSQTAGRDPYMIGAASMGDMSAQGAASYAGYGSLVYAGNNS